MVNVIFNIPTVTYTANATYTRQTVTGHTRDAATTVTGNKCGFTTNSSEIHRNVMYNYMDV